MKNYDFKLKMKTLWVWRDQDFPVHYLSRKEPKAGSMNGWGRLYWLGTGYVIHNRLSKIFPKLPKDPKELWQIKPNGEVIVWEWTP